jgi:hypothetical protein
MKELLCKTQYCCSFDSDTYLNNTQKRIIAFPLLECLLEHAETLRVKSIAYRINLLSREAIYSVFSCFTKAKPSFG